MSRLPRPLSHPAPPPTGGRPGPSAPAHARAPPACRPRTPPLALGCPPPRVGRLPVREAESRPEGGEGLVSVPGSESRVTRSGQRAAEGKRSRAGCRGWDGEKGQVPVRSPAASSGVRGSGPGAGKDPARPEGSGGPQTWTPGTHAWPRSARSRSLGSSVSTLNRSDPSYRCAI